MIEKLLLKFGGPQLGSTQEVYYLESADCHGVWTVLIFTSLISFLFPQLST